VWSRRLFPVWFFGLLILSIGGHSAGLFVIWLVLAGGYLVSVVVHPRARCLHCKGTGELRGSIFTWSFRRCAQCQGGRIIRWGASMFGLQHVRRQARAVQRAQENTTARQRW
jgi:hypothetical protein